MTIGLRDDGTVITTQEGYLEDWFKIVDIDAGRWQTVGLRSDGRVIAEGNNQYGECEVEDWRDIVAIAAGTWHTVGLKADGTVVAVGKNVHSESSLGGWTDITMPADLPDWLYSYELAF